MIASETCTHGPSAVTGERCGKPAVVSFTGSRGETFHECSEHAVNIPRFGREIGDKVEVQRYGKTYIATVVEIGARGAVYAAFEYANGTPRKVRV